MALPHEPPIPPGREPLPPPGSPAPPPERRWGEEPTHRELMDLIERRFDELKRDIEEIKARLR